MKSHKILLESLTPKAKQKVKIENGELIMPAEEKQLGKSMSVVYVPGSFKLPFRIDVTAKFNGTPSQSRWCFGNGQLYFNGSVIISHDIFTSELITPYYLYHTGISSMEFADISVIYGTNAMWITVNEKCCYCSFEAPYLKMIQNNNYPNNLGNGLDISFVCGTQTIGTFKSLTVTELEDDELDLSAQITSNSKLTDFELFVNGLPPEVHDEMYDTDDYLMNNFKKSLKFRRIIDKRGDGHLTYSSTCGFKVMFRELGVHGNFESHWIQSEKHPDLTNNIINILAETSPELAAKLYSNVKVCNPNHKKGPCRRTLIKLDGKTQSVCAGTIFYPMKPESFEDVRRYVETVNKVITKNS